MKKLLLMIGSVAMVAGLAACSDSDSEPNDNNAVTEDEPGENQLYSLSDLSDAQIAIAQPTNNFGWTLIDGLDEGENVVVSPLSASLALSVTASGTAGETRSEIVSALGLANYPESDVDRYYKVLSHSLSTVDAETTFSVANSFWSVPEIAVKKDFVSRIADSYKADVFRIEDATYATDVNRWCTEKTNGMIAGFLDPGARVPVMSIFNALYFKGNWSKSYEFAAADTKVAEFCNANGSKSSVSFMNKVKELKHVAAEDYSICQLPFGSGNFVLSLILPAEGVSLDACMAKVAAKEDLANSWVYGGTENISLALPKFNVEYNVVLNDRVKAMGVNKIFNNGDFSPLTDSAVSVDVVQQKVGFSILEEGCEAAVVTNVTMVTSPGVDMPEVKPTEMKLNRPFIFVLTEVTSRTNLLVGKISKL